MSPWLRPSRLICLLSLGGALIACSSDGAVEGEPCSKTVEPSFRVELTAGDGELPSDTRVEVTYGAGTEVYSPDDSTLAGKSVLCESWRGSTGVRAISCELWTSGAASLKVSATGYDAIDEPLSAERDECGIKTTEIIRQLERSRVEGEPSP